MSRAPAQTPAVAPLAVPEMGAYELLDVPVAVTDAHGGLRGVNAAFLSFTGLAPHAWPGRRFEELLCGDATDPAQRLWIAKRLRDGDAFAAVAFTGQDACGRALPMRLSMRMGRDGAVLLMQPALAEQRLRDDLARTSELLAMAQDFGRFGVWERDATTMAGRWDPHVWAIWGIPVDGEAPPLDQAMLSIPQPDRDHSIGVFQRSLANCGSYSVRYRLMRPDGELRHVYSHWEVRPGPDGLPQRALGIIQDETEVLRQSQREAELAHRLEMATNAAGVAVWSLDPTGRPHWDSQMRRLHGREEADLPADLDEYLERCIHLQDRATAREALRTLLARRGGLVEMDLRVLRPDGTVRRAATRTSAQMGPQGVSLYGVMLDVTERHAAEARLREASERVALVTRAVGIGTWRADPEATLGWWDEQMYRLRGLLPQDGPSTPEQRAACVYPPDLAANHDEMRRAVAQDRPSNSTFRVVWPDGTVRWLASRSTPVRDETGRTVQRIGINWDITESRAAAEAEHQRQLAQRESQAKSQFLARMSHELRTPLNAVLGFAQLLLTEREHADVTLQRRRIEHIHAAGEHLLSLINDVLDLSALESGELRLQLVPVALQALYSEALPLVENLARASRVSVQATPTGLAVLADPVRLRQVLINLLSNAVKYNRPAGQVSIETVVGGDQVHVRVTDTGNGMSDEQLRHVFEPFNRLGAERAGIEGTGIGLAIVKASMQRMGGEITVRSRLGEGSCFELTLPRASVDSPVLAAAAPAAAHAPAEPSAVRHRVLYIEDNTVNQLIVEELLRRRGDMNCVTAADGAEGVARALADLPELILVDMQLPDFDGHEVLRRLRADERTAHIRCVALSANAMPEDIERALQAGFEAYWTKPLDLRRFNSALDDWFGHTGAPD